MKDEENKMQSAAPEQQAQPEREPQQEKRAIDRDYFEEFFKK